ncbi:uncharacterized protein BX664DRAFT_270568 [Halteromyces radiatus]|uniref:uncharacterized protein n=1 Tax=Halteromyces radiatus TaxID=101107 RepID=UPI00221F882F|nr:uncharacterized protein BX664DRAFT_270568 [Halteromyces radiatus]KAI8077886.1 hypothetical protein BX664DRAFT_270568 [Halteromyces radiatus]
MQQSTHFVNSLTCKERRILVSQCIANVENVKEWLPGWFIKKMLNGQSITPNFEEIYHDNMIEWLSWAFFTASLDEVLQHSNHVKEIEWMVNEFESAFQIQFPKGYNDQLQSRRLNLDPINAYHRPLLFYVCIQLMTLLYDTMVLQVRYGMKKYGPEAVHSNLLWNPVESSFSPCDQEKDCDERISYWFRDGDRNKKPIVFIHGIGAGLMCYMTFVHQLVQLDAPIFCIELPFVSMRCVEDVPTMQEISNDIQRMLHRHDCRNAVFVAHSLGTAVASCELYISYYISRHFHWFQCALYVTPINQLHQNQPLMTTPMPHHTKIYLSEHDNIVNSSRVESYLKKHGLNSEMMLGLDHASFLVSPIWQQRIMDTVSSYIDDAK